MVFIKLKSSAPGMTVDDKVDPNVVLNGLDKLRRDKILQFSDMRFPMTVLFSDSPMRMLST